MVMNCIRPLVLALFSVALSACGASADAVCSAKCDCEGCSDREFDDCIDDVEDRGVSADTRGCTDEFDALLACQDDTGECRGDDFDTSCGPERDDLEFCMGDHDADETCILDADCDSGGHPFCNGAGRCVECTLDSHCGSGKECRNEKCD